MHQGKVAGNSALMERASSGCPAEPAPFTTGPMNQPCPTRVFGKWQLN